MTVYASAFTIAVVLALLEGCATARPHPAYVQTVGHKGYWNAHCDDRGICMIADDSSAAGRKFRVVSTQPYVAPVPGRHTDTTAQGGGATVGTGTRAMTAGAPDDGQQPQAWTPPGPGCVQMHVSSPDMGGPVSTACPQGYTELSHHHLITWR